MEGDIVEETVSGSEVKLGEVGLILVTPSVDNTTEYY